jgi:hypothetical protein
MPPLLKVFFSCYNYVPFVWVYQVQQSFDVLKCSLTSTPLVSPPDFDKDFILYISASPFSITGALVHYGLDGCKHDIYFVSNNLSRLSFSFIHEEKLALVVIFSI